MQPNPRNANAPKGRGASDAAFGDGLHRKHNPLDALLHALESATGRAPIRSGKGWRSRCPHCGGKSEKVSIAEAPTGAVLLHAFCGCDPATVLGACGLTLAAMFPRPLDAMTPADKQAARQAMRESAWRAALNVLGTEATVVEVAATMIGRTGPLTPDDIDRVRVAGDRIHSAREVLR